MEWMGAQRTVTGGPARNRTRSVTHGSSLHAWNSARHSSKDTSSPPPLNTRPQSNATAVASVCLAEDVIVTPWGKNTK